MDTKQTMKRYYYHFLGNKRLELKYKIKLKHQSVIWGSPEEYDPSIHELNEEISLLKTRKWRRRAWKNHLALPPRENSDYWDAGDFNHESTLTNQGIRYILDQYRQEKSAQREIVIKWATLIFAGIAAIGVLLKI